MKKEPIYNIVSHAHWDREWYLPFEEYRVWLVDMIDDLFDLVEKNPDFDSFLFDGQMAMVLDYLEVRPEMTSRFIDNVGKKKFIIGPWYVLTDQFLPSGESHIRNLMYGLQFARQLGEPMMVGYVPDQFGHIAQMPQILRGFGIDSAVIYRGFGGEPGQEPSEYRWCAPDGTSVLMVHLPKDGYSFGYFGADPPDEFPRRFQRLREEIDPRAQAMERLVLNGGDHHWVDPNVTDAAKAISEKLGAKVRLTNLGDYISRLKNELNLDSLSKVVGEMRFGLRHAFAVISGTASSRMYVKQANYECENLLEHFLEPLNALSVAVGRKSRSGLIKHAWKHVLQSQDHDVICGSSVDGVYEETMTRYAKVHEIVRRTSTQITNDLIPLDASQHRDDKFLFLFNPLPRPRSEVVECDIEFFLKDVVIGINPDVKTAPDAPRRGGFKLLDPEGHEAPAQLIARGDDFGITYEKYSYPHQTKVDKWKVLVLAENLPSTGYKRFAIENSDSLSPASSTLRAGDNFIENDFVKVQIEVNGSLTVTDKSSGNVLKGLNTFEDAGDIGDEYTYCPPDNGQVISSAGSEAEVRVVEKGPVRAALAVTVRMKIPIEVNWKTRERRSELVELAVTTMVRLACNSKRVDLRTDLVNNARDHRLRAIFETGTGSEVSYADAQFCIVRREHKKYGTEDFPYELPQNLEIFQRFVTVQGEKHAVTLFAKGLPEYELETDKPGTLALTLLRCVGNLSNSGLKTRPGGDAGWKNAAPGAQCPGPAVFEYSILVHGPVDDFTEINRLAEEYNSPVIPLARKHALNGHDEISFVRIEGDSIAFSAFKESEDGTGIILRCYNIGGKSSTGKVFLDFPVKSAYITDLDERERSELELNGSTVSFTATPHSIVTLKIKT